MGRWKAYYSDGSTFSSNDGTPWQAPRYGVQVIVCEWSGSRANRRVLGPVDKPNAKARYAFGCSYYCWVASEGHWLNKDLMAMVRYLEKEPLPCVLMGEYINEDLHGQILTQAVNDDFIPSGMKYPPHPAWGHVARNSMED